jgi:hypothetical protein
MNKKSAFIVAAQLQRKMASEMANRSTNVMFVKNNL